MAAPAPYVHRLKVRYHECDAQGVVFNANWLMYFDVAMTAMFSTAFGSYQGMVEAGADVMTVEATARFKAPWRFEDELEIAWAIERLGTTSMVSAVTATRDGATLVEGREVHVFVDPATHAKLEIPPHVRERLAPYVTA
jgi:acyl-CoA thioester hydrolase